ncbi:MAG: caspase family protein [Pseudorhodoplanes sp.]|nr:caspase family protein [Pseudorhodoplanes sp.]
MSARKMLLGAMAAVTITLGPSVSTAGAQGSKVEIVSITPHRMAYVVVFSPDGTRALSGGFDNTMKLWDVASGRLVRTFRGHTNIVRSVAFSPDGSRVLSGSQDNTIKLWDIATGKAVFTLTGHKETVNSVAFSPDGTRIVSGSRSFRGHDNTIRLWDVATGRQLRIFSGQPGEVSSVVFSPDGRTVLSGSGSDPWIRGHRAAMRLWDAATGQLLRTFSGHSNDVHSVAFSPDGSRALSGSWDNTIKLWEVNGGRLVRTFEGHKSPWANSISRVNSVAFSPDGASVASGGIDNTAKLWSVSTGRLLHTFQGHSGSVNSVAFSPDGSKVLSASDDNTLKLWSVVTGQLLRTFGGQSSSVNSVSVSPDGSRFLSGGEDRTVKLWDLTSGRLLQVFSGHEAGVQSVAFSSDGAQVRSGSQDRAIKIWDPASGNLIQSFKDVSYSTSFAFSSHATMAASGGNRTVKLWDLTTGKLTRELIHAQNLPSHCKSWTNCARSIGSVAVSSDGSRMASGGDDSKTKVWDLYTGQLLRTFSLDWGYTNAVAFSPDASRVLTGNLDNGVRLWDVATGRLLRLFDDHLQPIWSVAFSSDGTSALSGSGDNTVKLWDLATGRLVRTFEGHAGSIKSVAFSPDGTRVVTAGDDTTIKVWKRETGELLATFVGAHNREWLVITPEGFFNSSLKAGELLSIVRGLEVYAIDQLFQPLYRPDLVREKLAGDPHGKVKEASVKLDLDKVIASGGAPQITILQPIDGTRIAEDQVTVDVEVAERGGGLGRIEWRVNGVTLGIDERSVSVVAAQLKFQRVLSLDDGENVVEVVAYNTRNLIASEPARIKIRSDFATRLAPRLHVLAVGINDYWDSRLRLSFPTLDAKALGSALQTAGMNLYESVSVTTVLDQEVKRDRLDTIFSEIARNVRPRDVFVFFIAGHGKTVDGRYYFIPQDFRYDGDRSIVEKGISQEQFQAWFAKIPAKKSVLLFDTCESGSLIGERLAIRGLERVASLERLTRAMGRTVLSASTDDAPALEGYEGHGVFTYVLLDAFERADANGNGLIEVTELAGYVDAQVPEISQKAFNFRQVPQMKIIGSNFPLAKTTTVLSTSSSSGAPAIPRKATHVVIQTTEVFTAPQGKASVQKLEPGTLVTLIRTEQGWMLVAKDGNMIGYVAQNRLAAMH